MLMLVTTQGPAVQMPPLWIISLTVVLTGTASGVLSRWIEETFRCWSYSELRFCWHPNNMYNSCRLLTAVLLWHAKVLHHGWQQHSRKLQSGQPRQLHAAQNWNHWYGGQAGTTAEATQTQTSGHERFNTFWLLMAVHLSPISFLFFSPLPGWLIYCSAFLSPPSSLF